MSQPYERATLLVDDDADFLYLLERAFRKHGVTHPIHAVNGAEEAIHYLMGENKYADRNQYGYPSLVITDLKMPLVDGFAVLEHIHSNHSYRIVPTIVFSSSSDPDDVNKAYALGASAFHTKPINMNALERQVALLSDYWLTCQLPEIDRSGKRIETNGVGKHGERFKTINSGIQTRVGGNGQTQ